MLHSLTPSAMQLMRTASCKWNRHLPLAASTILAFFLYVNTLDAEFVYDDSRAVISNQDLRPETPWRQLLMDDFWGTPLRHSGSHKSYRPLTVATFRLNYYFDELNPFGYHLINVLLHTVVTGLVVSLATRLSNGDAAVAWTSGLLFAAHPVHTEAVSGVVGRADLLTTFCFLLCIRSYFTLMDRDASLLLCTKPLGPFAFVEQIARVFLFLLWATGAVLAKEHGLTVLAVCLCYDVILTSRTARESHPASTHSSPVQRPNHRLASFDRQQHWQRSKQSSPVNKQQQNGCSHASLSAVHFRHLLTSAVFDWLATRSRSIKCRATRWTYVRWSILIASAFLLAFFRLWLMGFSAPSFSPSDNPAAHSDSLLTRLMTFSYLIAFNAFLLVCPTTLSFDWSMDSVPLLERVSDPRNLLSLSVLLGMAYLALCILRRVTSRSRSMDAVSTVPGTPRSASISQLTHNSNSKSLRQLVDVNGNSCSLDDPALWTGRISPNTAKSFQCALQNCSSNGVSSYKLKFRAQQLESLKPLNVLASIDSDFESDHSDHHELTAGEDATALMGLLITVITFLPACNLFFYVGLVVAERILYLVSVGSCLLVSVGLKRLWRFWCSRSQRRPFVLFLTCCLSVLLTLCAKTAIRNMDWKNEQRLYSSGIPVNPAKAYSNLGNVYAQKRLTDLAVRAYRAALSHRPNMADTHYNYGILLQERGDARAAALAYENAIKCRPRMALAHLNMGIVLTSLQQYKEAEQRYKSCSELSVDGLRDPRSHESAKLSCLYNLGRLYADQNRYSEAIDAYRSAVRRLHPYYQSHSLYNALGDALSKTGHHREAEDAFKKSLSSKPDHIPAHLTYGHLLAKTNRRKEAFRYLERASVLAPSDSVVWQHLGQFHSDGGEFQKASDAYKEARRLDPNAFDATFGLANAYRNLAETTLAEEFYEKAALLRPSSANARMNFGAMLHMNKKWDRAEEEYLAALKINPGDELTKENLRKLRKAMSKK